MKTQTYLVSDMTCGGCQKKIEREVTKLTGIGEIEADLVTKRLTITYDDAHVTNDAIIQAISDAGYTAEND